MESPKGVCSRASRKEYAAHLRSEAAKQVKRAGEQMTRSYIIPLLFQEQRHALRSGRLEERVSTLGFADASLAPNRYGVTMLCRITEKGTRC
ncbi:unnamed protein product [Cochlearia groenlandica]